MASGSLRISQTPDPPPASSGTTSGASRATAITIGLVLLSRVLGVLRDILLAHLFGQNKQTDLYRAAFGVPDLIALVIAGGALASVFVPVFTQYWNDKREDEAWHVFGTIMSVITVAVALLVGAMEFGVVPLTAFLNKKFTDPQVLETARLSAILLPAQWFLIVGGFFSGTLNARKRFTIPALSPVIYNAGAIAGGLSQIGRVHPSMSSMAIGTLVGAVVGSFLLPLIELIRVGVKWKPGFDVDHAGVRKVGRQMLPVILGLSLGQLIMWVTIRCLPADSRISAFTNAYNLTQAPIGIFAQGFAIVLFPTISGLAAKGEWKEFRKAIRLGICNVLFLTLPASLLMSALALPLIRLVFLSPKFTDANAHAAATALLCYSLSTFAWSGLAVLARGFYARQDTWTPVLITTPMVFVFYGLVKLSLAINQNSMTGVPLSASAVGALTFILFLHFLQKRVGGLNIRYIVQSVIRTLIAALIGAGVAHLIAQWCDIHFTNGRLGSAVTLALAGGVGVVLFVGVSRLFRSPELRAVGSMFRRRPAGTA